jgi:cellulose synthase/poly-beta-1,6-N-acetylglucosamine synthase-like glycosyltransferase
MMAALALLAAGVLALPAAVICGEVLSAILSKSAAPAQGADTSAPTTTILMPAHNEASVIAETLAALTNGLPDNWSLVVIADNCTDDTATIARDAGAQVIERRDLSEIGKSYALAYGQSHLKDSADNPEVVVILDADCAITWQHLMQLSAKAKQIIRPVQARYLLDPPKNASPGKAIAAFAVIVKNWVRPAGLHALGLPCQLMGTGMAFPWQLFQDADLANGSIVEDIHLGFELAAAGSPPYFLEECVVESTFPDAKAAQNTQRTRWEHGHLQSILALGPRMLWRGIVSGNLSLIAMSLDLMVPPLAFYILVLGGAWACSGAAVLLGFSAVPLGVLSIALSALGACILLAWSRYGRNVLSLKALILAAGYVLGKIPLYVKAIFKPQKEWVRTDRDDPS